MNRRTSLKAMGGGVVSAVIGTSVFPTPSATNCRGCGGLEHGPTETNLHPDEHTLSEDCVYHEWGDRLNSASVVETHTSANNRLILCVRDDCDDRASFRTCPKSVMDGSVREVARWWDEISREDTVRMKKELFHR